MEAAKEILIRAFAFGNNLLSISEFFEAADFLEKNLKRKLKSNSYKIII
jgi:hypothetical protein